MLKKLFLLTVFGTALILGQTSHGYDVAGDPALLGWWECDEGAGAIVSDSSGNGNDGTFVEGDPVWVEGIRGSAVELTNPTRIEIPALNVDLSEATMAGWMKPYGSQPDWSAFLMTRGVATGFNVLGFQLAYHWNDTGDSWGFRGGDLIADNEWTFAALAVHPDRATFYVNGVEGSTNTVNHGTVSFSANLYMGGDTGAARRMTGALDDVSIFSRALSGDEIKVLMNGLADPALAGNVAPASDATDVPRDVSLSWSAGKYAVKHDVYLGTSFEDVNNADAGVLVSQGQTGTMYTPDAVLEFGETYYWRVDEVNGAPDNTVFAGKPWAFTVEPMGYPIADVTATASSSHQDTMGPENTVNGSGLNEMGEHDVEPTTMWLSGMGDPTPSIQYEFDKTYKLYEMQVWNSNQIIESFIGLGAKDVVIEYSADGAEWTVLEGATQFAQATGSSSYTANTMIDFGGVMAKFVKITISAGYGMMPQYGLSEVRFLFIPTFAREPQPADGAVTEAASVTLSWRAGREAVSHQVKLGTDAADLALAGTTSAPTFAANGLDYSTTYFWSITEVNENEAVSAHTGDLWSFTTPDYGTVDDFDQYDDNCNRIFFSWEDGLGHSGGEEIDDCTVAPSNGNGGGSIVGNDTAPFAERTIVNDGSSQSLPFNYDNAFGQSETTRSLSGQDWTASGVQTLSLAFRGTADNTGTLYVKINNTKVAYDGDPADIAQSGWLAWNIDLSTVSGLQNVTSLTIGVDGGNAAGMLYIDDIRLYPLTGELITPADPGTANLAGAWNFDEGSGAVIGDSSGNGHGGTIEGNTNSWVPGVQGTALSMGNNVYVSVPAAAWATIDTQFTVSFWALGDAELGNNWGFFAGDASGRLASSHLPWGNDVIFDTTTNWSAERIMKAAAADELRGQWRHWVFVKNADTGEKQAYLDGRLYASVSASTDPITGVDRFFIGAGDAGDSSYLGLMDEFQLFNRALSAEEALWLAGGTSPIHKPF
jgi:hypothetical protein